MRVGLFGLVVLVAGSLSAAETWMQFRGPGGQGISAEVTLPTTWSARDNVIWKTALPGPGTSSPIFVGDKIYLTCYSGYNVPGQAGEMDQLRRHLVCLNRTSGKLLWTKDIPAKLPEQERRPKSVAGEVKPQQQPPPGGLVLTIYDRPLGRDRGGHYRLPEGDDFGGLRTHAPQVHRERRIP